MLPFGFNPSLYRVDAAPSAPPCSPIRTVAFYLPQFHPTEINDINWGNGFTEWNNVARGTQEFTGHHQPRAPADYGFYDLRVPEIQERQAIDAANVGISAFCYYFYWFDGYKPLPLPLDRHLQSKNITLPFCICFANENWTKTWDGLESDILLKQTYGEGFADRFWADAVKYLRSEKYLRDAKERPFLLVYRPAIIPDFDLVAKKWRILAAQEGFPGLHIVTSMAFDPPSRESGIDSYYEFPPLATGALNAHTKAPSKKFTHGRCPASQSRVHDYRQYLLAERVNTVTPPDTHPTVMPDWDNTARRPFRGDAFDCSTPGLFQEWTERAARRAAHTDEKLMFINAWNEWAEGAYLEPDQRYGWAYAHAFRAGVDRSSRATTDAVLPICIFAHVHYADVWEDMAQQIENHIRQPFSLVITTTTSSQIVKPVTPYLRAFELHRMENRGRDILPFLWALENTNVAYDVGLKIHTKRSPHRVDGDEWRKIVLDCLIPECGVSNVVDLMVRDPNIGFIAPTGHWAPLRSYLGSNLKIIGSLLGRLGRDFNARDIDTGRFIAGSMFWFRHDAISGISYKTIEPDFEKEAGQLDGTAAHAMEQLFSIIGEQNGYLTILVDEVDSALAELAGVDYPVSLRLSRFSDQRMETLADAGIALAQVDVVADIASIAKEDLSIGQFLDQQIEKFNGGGKAIPAVFSLYRRLPLSLRRRMRMIMGRPIA